MSRADWSFEYTAARLAEAATAKRNHHQDRLRWWEDQREKVMAEVRESGLEVSESLTMLYSGTAPGRGPQVMVRTDLQNKLSECHQKITQHQIEAAEYDGWHQVLSSHSEARLPVSHGDWLYFFGK